jgi:D-glycero-D-manno-heptose 1,7-bisphosphate phosphatase
MATANMKLVVLDRDGTINVESDEFIKSPEEWVPLPGALEAIARLNHAGWHVVLATNQSGLERGLFDMSALNAMHQKMHSMLAAVGGRVEAVFLCPHAPDAGCHCAKPNPGLFELIAERFGANLKGVPVVGDRVTDMLAGVAVGCEPHLVCTGHGGQWGGGRALSADFPAHTRVHADLSAFADWWLQHQTLARPSQSVHTQRNA